MNYPLLSKVTLDERTDRRVALLACASIILVVAVLWLWSTSRPREQNIGLQLAWKAVYFDERITSQLGKVVVAQIKQEWRSRRRGMSLRDVHDRTEINGIVRGRIEFLVVGEKESGAVVIHETVLENMALSEST